MNNKYVNFDTDNTISKYFKEVKKSKILTPKEELNIAKRIQNGDNSAIQELVNANLKFAISIAKRYQGNGLPLSDLINEANYGLIKAASRFDHTKGFRFISYAITWIKQSIIQSLNDNARLVRLPTNVITRLAALKKNMDKLEFNDESIFGEFINENKEDIELLKFNKHSSLNEPMNEEGDELIDCVVGDNTYKDNEIIVDDKIKKVLNETLDVLDERERNIIECYFGINTGCEPMTLEAIGDKYQLTKERVRQIKAKSLRKLKHNSEGLFNIMNE